MTKDEMELLLFLQERQAIALEKIAKLLEQQFPRPVPNYQSTLNKFPLLETYANLLTVELVPTLHRMAVQFLIQRRLSAAPSPQA